MGTKLKILIIAIILFTGFAVGKTVSAAITIRPALVFSTGGSITISSSKNINTDTLTTGRSCADGGDGVAYSVTVLTTNTATLSASPAAGCLSANDRVMLINLQADGTNLTNVGNYEFLVVSSVVTNTVTFTSNKTKYYGNGAVDDTNIGTATTTQRVILQRVPQYYNVTIQNGGTLTASGWDGVMGGVLAFYASGKVDVQSGGSIDMTGKGYRGGGANGYQGESYNKLGVQSTATNYGGGGGSCWDDLCWYSKTAPGGSYGSIGDPGDCYGGGSIYGSPNLDKLFIGSGGGGNTYAGRNGGGILLTIANLMSLSGSVSNNGSSWVELSGGAGSGGSVYLKAVYLNIGSSLITAIGGAYGFFDYFDGCFESGGAGGVGRIHLKSNNISGTTNPAAVTSSLSITRTLAPNNAGLVGYWSFEEGKGSQAGDMSGRGNNGNINGATWIDGKRGKGIDFNGTSNYISISDAGSSSLDVSSSVSISLWVNPDTLANGYHNLIAKGTSSINYFIDVNGTTDLVDFNGPHTCVDLAASTTLPIGTWTHIVGVYDDAANTQNIYFNGVLDTSNSCSNAMQMNDAAVRIGDFYGVEYFNGKIDEIRIYNRALSAAEVVGLYQSSGRRVTVNSSQNNQITTGLVGLWSFNGPDISGSLALDRSGFGNNGTISGAIPTIGKVGQGVKFDGSTNQYIDVGSSNSYFATTSPTTISAWIYPKSIGGGSSGRIIHRRGTADVNGGDFQLTATNALLFGFDGTTALRRTSSNNAVSLNSWQHVLATWDGSLTASNIHLFVNGAETSYQTTQNGSGIYETNNQSTRIGNRHDGGRTFDGTIDEVRVYNRVLSADEIKRLYNMGR